jgi:murein DD-endopeptidase MepM/ murein hydrolase activator NlpD
MKKLMVLCGVLLVLSQVAFSQKRDVTISYQTTPNGDGVFTAANSDYCDYFVTLTFSSLINATASPTIQLSAPAGLSQIYRLTPVRKNEPIRFGFSYSYIKGNANPKINAQFKYLLPVKEGKRTQVNELKNLSEFLGKPLPPNWYALSYSMEEGDTVYAARGGVVCRINPSGKATMNTGTIYTSSTNSVEIFHDDGTFGRYDLLKKEGILVKSGDKVNAGDPIGIIGRIYGKTQLNFIVYYLDKRLINTDGAFLTAGYSSYKPKFALAEKAPATFIIPGETYTAIKPIAVILQEMSKREKDKFLEAGKK